jgi:predicted NACHT family NTPase
MTEKKQNSMATMGEELRQLQQELAKERDKKWRLEEIMQTTSEALSRYKNEPHQYKIALVQFIDQFEQERLKYHTNIQRWSVKYRKINVT